MIFLNECLNHGPGPYKIPDDFPHLRDSGRDFAIWYTGDGNIHIESTLEQNQLEHRIQMLNRAFFPDYAAKDIDSFVEAKQDKATDAARSLAGELVRNVFGPTAQELFPEGNETLQRIVAAAEQVLREDGFMVCHPYTLDGRPCYESAECATDTCPFVMKGTAKPRYNKEGTKYGQN